MTEPTDFLPHDLQKEIDDTIQDALATVAPPKPTFEVLRERKLSDAERLPLMVNMTNVLRDETSKTGFSHVQQHANGKYYAFYKGINTGYQATAMLAAYELLKLAKYQKIDVTEKLRVDYYPEYFCNVPSHIDVSKIEHLRDPSVKAGWQGIKLRNRLGVRSFVCDIVIDGIAHRTKTYPTPVEAVWAAFLGKGKQGAAHKAKPDIAADFIDMSVIAYLQEGSGYKYVYKRGSTFYGRFTVNGVAVTTRQYKQPEQVAWVIHHHLLDAPFVDSPETRAAALKSKETALMLKARISQQYSSIKKSFNSFVSAQGCACA